MEYITINDYAFNILRLNKCIHCQYGPINKPLIMNELIQNECKKMMFGHSFSENKQWNPILPDNAQYIKKYSVKK